VPKGQPLEVRFWEKVEKCPDGCWRWTSNHWALGYGAFNIGKKNHAAPRVAYELAVGPIPEGMSLDHLCRVRNCVNPAHLEPVTHRENVLRGTSPAAIHALKTHCPAGHEYSADNLVKWHLARGRRVCRICLTEAERRRRKTPEYLAAKRDYYHRKQKHSPEVMEKRRERSRAWRAKVKG
jgi:hypothetical protein